VAAVISVTTAGTKNPLKKALWKTKGGKLSSIGSLEMLLIIFIAMIVIGPEHARTLIRMIGRVVRAFKRAIEELKNEDSIKKEIDGINELIDVSTESTITEELQEIKTETEKIAKTFKKGNIL
jgi:Sec-independent protein translocase protein TatA